MTKKNLDETLAILASKLNFISVDSRSLTADNGATLHINTELNGTRIKITPSVQVVLSLVVNDRRVWFYGSLTNEDNDKIVDWFLDLKNKVRRDIETRKDNESTKLLKSLGL